MVGTNPILRPAVLTDEVLEPIRQRRRANGGIERNGVLEVDGLSDEADGGQQGDRHAEEQTLLHTVSNAYHGGHGPDRVPRRTLGLVVPCSQWTMCQPVCSLVVIS